MSLPFYDGQVPTASDFNQLVVKADLATPTGAATVGAEDGSSGALWTTVAGFFVKIISSAGAAVIGWIQSGTGAISRSVQDKLRESLSVNDFGIVSDGSTDQTTALTTFFTNNATYRGTVLIPYNTKFNKAAVYAVAPVGMILIDDSSINTGQPPGYKNKTRRTYTNDSVSDDMTTELASSHHPALRLNNLGTAGTSSATSRYHSIIRSAGYRWNNDPIDGMQLLTYKSSRGNLWRTSDILNTPYDYAVNATKKWAAATTFVLGDRINSSDGGVWIVVTAGTSGGTEPNGIGPTYYDSTITWTYQGVWSVGRTTFYYDEDGYGGISGTATARFGAETATKKGLSINADESTGDTYLRDDQRSADLWRASSASGLQSGIVQSMKYGGALSGATPTLTANFHVINNAGATNMTNLLLPSSQVRARVTLFFSTAATTVVNTGGNFNLKGNTNATPTAGSIMEFILEPLVSGGWCEVSRNF